MLSALSSSQQAGVPDAPLSLADLRKAVDTGLVPLPAESAGYLLLAIADQLLRAPLPLDERGVLLSSEGTVSLLALTTTSRSANGDTATLERQLRELLRQLLSHAPGSAPALSAVARRPPQGHLEPLIRELEAALIPVNRAAGRRALARVQREVERVRHRIAGAPPLAPPRPAAPRHAVDRHAPERAAVERVAVERVAVERVAVERAAVERPTPERSQAERPTPERPTPERPTPERLVSAPLVSERAATQTPGRQDAKRPTQARPRPAPQTPRLPPPAPSLAEDHAPVASALVTPAPAPATGSAAASFEIPSLLPPAAAASQIPSLLPPPAMRLALTPEPTAPILAVAPEQPWVDDPTAVTPGIEASPQQDPEPGDEPTELRAPVAAAPPHVEGPLPTWSAPEPSAPWSAAPLPFGPATTLIEPPSLSLASPLASPVQPAQAFVTQPLAAPAVIEEPPWQQTPEPRLSEPRLSDPQLLPWSMPRAYDAAEMEAEGPADEAQTATADRTPAHEEPTLPRSGAARPGASALGCEQPGDEAPEREESPHEGVREEQGSQTHEAQGWAQVTQAPQTSEGLDDLSHRAPPEPAEGSPGARAPTVQLPVGFRPATVEQLLERFSASNELTNREANRLLKQAVGIEPSALPPGVETSGVPAVLLPEPCALAPEVTTDVPAPPPFEPRPPRRPRHALVVTTALLLLGLALMLAVWARSPGFFSGHLP